MTVEEFKVKVSGNHTSSYIVKMIKEIPHVIFQEKELAIATRDNKFVETVYEVKNTALQCALSSTFGYPTVFIGGFDRSPTEVTWTHGCLSTGLHFELVRLALRACKCRIITQR